MAPGRKDPDGNSITPSDAKLLEMTGTSVDAALKLATALRMQALEQISAPRKDPERMKGPMSGAAMQHLDEDNIALLNELRNSYGENGELPLMRKLVMAAMKIAGFPAIKPGDISLQWPTLLKSSAGEVSQLITAFSLAINPLQITIRGLLGARPEEQDQTPEQDKKSGQGQEPPDTHSPASGTGGLSRRATTGDDEALDFTGVKLPEQYMIVKPAEARAYMARNLDMHLQDEDLSILEEDDEEGSLSNMPHTAGGSEADNQMGTFRPTGVPAPAPDVPTDVPATQFGMTILPPSNVT